MVRKYLFSAAISVLALTAFGQNANALSLEFLKRGFKHCTGVCDKQDICGDQKKFEWCIKNCSHKMDPKGMCARGASKGKTQEEVQEDIIQKYKKDPSQFSEKERQLMKQLGH